MIRDGTRFRDLGADFFLRLNTKKILNRSVKQIESLGFKVTVEEKVGA
jgi:hypothetical protein